MKGKPGAGKSTITKYALNHANATYTGERNIYFFFNARGERLEKCNEGMYRSLLHQIAQSVPSLVQSIHAEAVEGYATAGWPLDLLRSWFREAALRLASNTRLTCYIDALDESENEDQAREMVRFFEELAETAVSNDIGLSIYFASRHYPNITIRRSETLILDDCRGHHADIASYVDNKLLCRPPSLKAELAAGIIERSSGIFLWAVLVVRILSTGSDRGNQHRLKASLQATPKGLDDLFSEIISKDDAEGLLLPTLLWVLFAKRPLFPLELYHAVVHSANVDSSTCDQVTIDEESAKNFITSSSRGLLQVFAPKRSDIYLLLDEVLEESKNGQDSIVQFIHESAREYLLEKGLLRLDPTLTGNLVGISNLRLARWCQSYVEMGLQHVFPRLNKTDVETPLLLSSNLRKVAPFSRYALPEILHHSERAASCGLEVPIPFEDCLHEYLSCAVSLIESYSMRPYIERGSDHTMLHVLAVEGHPSLVTKLLQRHDHIARANYIDVRVEGGYEHHSVALHLAAQRRRLDVVRVLLENGADVNACDGNGDTTLLHAVQYGLTEVVGMVLDHGADVNTRDKRHRTALHHAIKRHSLVAIEALIRYGADVNIPDSRGVTPLTLAIKVRDRATVEVLLAHNPNVDAQDENGCTALYHAVSSPYWSDHDIVDLLLRRGANVSIRDNNNNETLLIASVHNGFSVEDVKLLLKYGADVNASGRTGSTAIHAAVQRGDLQIIKIPLQNNAEVDARSNWEGTALFLVILVIPELWSANTKVSGVLLKHDANVNAVNMLGATALRTAVFFAKVAVVKTLLEYGADVYSHQEGQPSIIDIAHEWSNKAVIRLLAYFADVPPHERSEAARTLEQQGWWKDHLLRETLLLKHGLWWK